MSEPVNEPVARSTSADPPRQINLRWQCPSSHDTLPWRWLWRGVRPGLDPKCLLISGIVLLVLLVWSWAIGWLQSPVSEDFLSEALDRITVIVVNPGALIRNPAVLGSAIAGVGGLLSMRWLEAVLIGGPTLILVALVVIVTARLKVGAVAGVSMAPRSLRGFLRRRLLGAMALWVGMGGLWLLLWWLIRVIAPETVQDGLVLLIADVAASSLAVVLLVVSLLMVVALPVVTAVMAVEDADVIEATQRVLAYLVCRPVRSGLAWLVSTAAGVLLVATVLWLGRVAQGVVNGAMVITPSGGASSFMDARSTWNEPSLVNWWPLVVGFVAGSIALSYAGTGSVALYLWLRERIDGQDHADLYTTTGATDA